MSDAPRSPPRSEANEDLTAMLVCELHDGPCQQLTAALYHFTMSRELYSVNPADSSTAFDRGLDLLRRGLYELRGLVSGAGAICVEGQTLTVAISKLIREYTDHHGLRIAFRCTVPELILPSSLQIAVFRIIQEALLNVKRHAARSAVQVTISANPETLHLEVEDNGRGFDTAAISAGSFGIAGMRARAAFVGGNLTVISNPGHGTLVVAHLPLVKQQC